MTILSVTILILVVMFVAFVAGVGGGFAYSVIDTQEKRKTRDIIVTTSIDGKKLLAIKCSGCNRTTMLSRVYESMKEWRAKKK